LGDNVSDVVKAQADDHADAIATPKSGSLSKVRAIAFRWLARRYYTASQLKTRLRTHDFIEADINQVLSYLIELDYVNDHDRPLGLYYFGEDKKEQERVLTRTVSGGVTTNDVVFHVSMEDLPFGGVGPSGMGSYHAIEGFREFSHARAVYHQPKIDIAKLGGFKPPYGKATDKAADGFHSRQRRVMETRAIDVNVPVAGFMPDGAAFQTGLLFEQIEVAGIQYDAAAFGNQPCEDLLARLLVNLDPVKVQPKNLLNDVFHGDREADSCLGLLLVLSDSQRRDIVDGASGKTGQIMTTHRENRPQQTAMKRSE